MESIVIKNIKEIIQTEHEPVQLPRAGKALSQLSNVKDGYIAIENGTIASFGETSFYENDTVVSGMLDKGAQVIDASGKMVMPAFCDSHTHLVYAGSREMEYSDKLRGLSYQEIAARGGGILNSANLLHNTTEEELYRQSVRRAWEIMGFGTGAVEIKSGYGLTPSDEIKMLRVAKRIGEETPLTVKTTFLGAHAVPERYKGRREEYVNEIINEMIPVIATEELADYIDVFTEEGFFSVEDTDRIFNAGIKYGLRPKIHANQMSFSGGVQVAAKYGAISADHLEFTSQAEFEALKQSGTIATLLPGSTFFLEMEYAPAREMINYGLPLAIATNYNPGSSPSGDMKFMMALACLKMKLTPEEAINAVTINGAFAMDLGESHGSIAIGKQANLIITKEMPSYEFIPYAFTTPLVETLVLNGKVIGML
ncbi:MAG: imidazolonepropionase [Rikenellaceae bacterium]|nr:imidazolonepropionase [Rikenellaceae bacterium]